MAHGVRHGAALWVDDTLQLNDYPLALQVVDHNLEVLEDMVASDAVLVAQLPSGAIVRKGDPLADIYWDKATRKVASVVTYTITQIRQFPDGRVKVTMTMDSDPSQVAEQDDARWVIQDWWPAVGDSFAEYLQARQRAGGY